MQTKIAARGALRAAAALLLAGAALAACAPSAPDRIGGPEPDRIGGPEPSALRVGTSGDYAPFSIASSADGSLTGFDLEIARAFATDLGRPLAIEGFRWPALLDDLTGGAFDVAMSGVTIRPERSVRGRFSVPVATSGAVLLTLPARAAEGIDGLDRAGIRIAVNAGGHLERVARGRFRRARLVPLPENDAVRRALAEGRVEAVVTDTLEAPHWQRSLPGVVRLGPFSRDRKAYLWRAGAGDASEALDAWLLAREADGRLSRWRARWLAAPGPATATPAAALVAGIGERLGLMPYVAETKRARGIAVRDRAREARVLEAAFVAVVREARRLGRAPLPRPLVDAFYRAQIEAAVAIQQRILATDDPGVAPGFDLAMELRPALLRIGDRIAWLLVRLDEVPDAAILSRELAALGLGAEYGDAMREALANLVQARVNARASKPAITGRTSDTP